MYRLGEIEIIYPLVVTPDIEPLDRKGGIWEQTPPFAACIEFRLASEFARIAAVL